MKTKEKRYYYKLEGMAVSFLRKKKETLKGYKKYLELYNKTEKRLKKKGLKMYDKVLDVKTYEEYYEDAIKEKELLKSKGMKYSKNFNRDIVSGQTYETSYKQAKSLRKGIQTYYEKEGLEIPLEIETMSIKDIQEGNVDWDVINDRYHELREAGLSGKDAGKSIAGMYFGS